MSKKKFDYAIRWLFINSPHDWITRKVDSKERAVYGADAINKAAIDVEAQAVYRPRRRWYQFPGEWEVLEDEGHN